MTRPMAGARGGWTEDDWYRDGEDQIHFFPFPKVLVWTKGKKILAQVEAWGGQKAMRGRHYAGTRPHLTTPGGYVISGWGPYTTHKWDFSCIRWGTPLRVDPSGKHVLYRAETGTGQAATMVHSHACIHVRPIDLQRLLRLGAFKVGRLLFVHGSNEIVIETLER